MKRELRDFLNECDLRIEARARTRGDREMLRLYHDAEYIEDGKPTATPTSRLSQVFEELLVEVTHLRWRIDNLGYPSPGGTDA